MVPYGIVHGAMQKTVSAVDATEQFNETLFYHFISFIIKENEDYLARRMDPPEKFFLYIRSFAYAAYDFHKRRDNGTRCFKADHLNHVKGLLDGGVYLVD